MERTSIEDVARSQVDLQSHGDSDQFRLLEAESVIFDKFDDVVRRKQHVEPEKNLMFAILEEGISCFQKQLFARTHKGKNLFREAEAWILQKDADRIFSFDSICETLGISPNYLRTGLIAWKNRQLQSLGRANGCDAEATLRISSVSARFLSAS